MPSEARQKPRALNLEKRVYTRSPLAGGGPDEKPGQTAMRGPALVLPNSPLPPVSPQPSRLLTPKSSEGPKMSDSNRISNISSNSNSTLAPEPTLDERRTSGVGTYDVGLGLLSDSLSDSDDSDREDEDESSGAGMIPPRATSPLMKREPSPRQPQPQPAVGLGIRAPVPVRAEEDMAAKHRALFEAATSPPPPAAQPQMRTPVLSPPPAAQRQMQQLQSPITPPPPSYASPVHRPHPPPLVMPSNNPYTRSPAPPYLTPPSAAHGAFAPPPPLSPHPLPPSSPITPLFAAPRGVRFSMPLSSPSTPQMGSLTLMRSEKEDALPVRKRDPSSLSAIRSAATTDDGDAFWRRFSLVAKTEQSKPPTARRSAWLSQRLRTSRHIRRLLVFSVSLFCIAVAGGVAAAWIFTHKSGDSVTAPIAIGGSAGETGIATSSTAAQAGTPWVPPNRRWADAVETGTGSAAVVVEGGAWAEMPLPTAGMVYVGLQ